MPDRPLYGLNGPILRRALFAACLVFAGPASAAPAAGSGPATAYERTPPYVLLWPNGAPGAVGPEREDSPALYVFPAPAGKANGAAAVVCPGGAYGILAMEKEGYQVAEWLNTLGISAFVLRYRLGPRYRHPAQVTDAKRAMRWVRANAKRYGIDPLRIGMVGFSAGGHLAATLATRYDGGRAAPDDSIDAFPCQPAFQVLIYPVITMEEGFGHRASRRNLLGPAPDTALVSLLSNEKHVTAAAPPAFLAHARTDPVVSFKNSEAYAEALRKAGVSFEFRAYESGTHAFGLGRETGPEGRPEPSDWPYRCALWLGKQGFIPPAKPARPRKPAPAGSPQGR